MNIITHKNQLARSCPIKSKNKKPCEIVVCRSSEGYRMFQGGGGRERIFSIKYMYKPGGDGKVPTKTPWGRGNWIVFGTTQYPRAQSLKTLKYIYTCIIQSRY